MPGSPFYWPPADNDWFHEIGAACAKLPRETCTFDAAMAVISPLPSPLSVPSRFVAGLIREAGANAHASLNTVFVTSTGVWNGAERMLVRALLPARYDSNAFAEQSLPAFDGPRRYLAPHEAFDVMLDASLRYLTHWAINPHHPVQDFIGYWASALAHVADAHFDAPLPGTETTRREQILSWMQVLHFYRNPRGPQQEENAASRLRHQLVAVLDGGAGGQATLAAMWQNMKSGRDRLPHRAVHALPARLLHACSKTTQQEQSGPNEVVACPPTRANAPDAPTWPAMREVVEAYRSLGFTDHVFDAQRIDLVDIGDLVSSEFARCYWGYWSPKDRDHYASGVDVLAYRYRLDLGSRLSLCEHEEIRVELQLLHIVADRAETPLYELLVVPYLYLAPGLAGCDWHTVLSERQVVNHLFREHGLALVRAEHRGSCEGAAGVRREDAEFFSMEREKDCIEHAAWRRDADSTIRPWDGKHRKDTARSSRFKSLHEVHGTRRQIDLAAFQQAVMKGRSR